MDYKKSRSLLHICCVVGALVCVLNLEMGGPLWPSVLGLLLLIGGLIQHCIFCRCPHCGVLFNSRVRLPKHCPECGKELE